jgi:hypothetical protein
LVCSTTIGTSIDVSPIFIAVATTLQYGGDGFIGRV